MTRPNLYPIIKDYKNIPVFGQVQKVVEELEEVMEAWVSGEKDNLCVECHDVLQATFTLMDVVAHKTGMDVWSYRQEMIQKNHERAKYNSCCSCGKVADTEEDGKWFCISCYVKRRGE